MWPEVGCSSPATRRRRVDFPAPLVPTRPDRPGPTRRSRLLRAGVPSGQAKVRPDAAMTEVEEDMEAPREVCGRGVTSTEQLDLPSSGMGLNEGRRWAPWTPPINPEGSG